MFTRKDILLLCLLATLGAVAVPASAEVNFSVDLMLAPPPPRYEVMPPPRVGFIWAPGYWRWDGHRHVWMGGRWMQARPGYHFVGEHWERRDGRNHFEAGRWERDSGHHFAEHDQRGYARDYRR